MQRAIRYFERAVQLDPDYALAHASIALAYSEIGESGAVEPEKAYPRAEKAVNAALALDSGLADAHLVNGTLKVVWRYDWPGAERDFRRAIELNPNNADAYDFYSRLCSSLGRHDESISLVRRAQQLDPLTHRSDYATSLLRADRYAEALQEAELAAELDPQYDRVHATLGWALLRSGRVKEGIDELEKAVSISPGTTLWYAQLGQAYAEAGRTEDARQVLRRLTELSSQQYVSPYHFAYVLTGLGEPDRAIDWLERAYHERAGAVYGIKGSFLFAALRTHPRFIALLRKMNLA
jgi:tetratricopeptide (TPR) repeat protein